MTQERKKAINEWLDIHCRKCANNDDRGTDYVNCQAECEVQNNVGIACIHYEEYVAESEEMTFDEAIEHAEAAEWVNNKCSICGKGIEDFIDSREWYENEKPNYCPFCGKKFKKSEK